jgi:hypothetical protein
MLSLFAKNKKIKPLTGLFPKLCTIEAFSQNKYYSWLNDFKD